ncbi:MAG: hypothetical protein ABJJ25_03650 [Eudoraea sp.]
MKKNTISKLNKAKNKGVNRRDFREALEKIPLVGVRGPETALIDQ